MKNVKKSLFSNREAKHGEAFVLNIGLKSKIKMTSIPKTIDEAFMDYRTTYIARSPDLSNMSYDDELHLITAEDGLFCLSNPPVELEEYARIEDFWNTSSQKYLWVVAKTDVRLALEKGENRKTLDRGFLSHTNLTGGDEAHSGGEAWFLDCRKVVINGGSSRYKPRNETELDEIVTALSESGYMAAHLGWDEGSGRASRIKRGELRWK
ncbi:MAG TPA: hypothetical protein PK916_13365 [Bacteroidota bacterium]|nr:hypothetical protein [Bacteroidota bacterium]